MNDDHLRGQYDTLTDGTGFVELEQRCCVRLTGADRQSFFHNFCTNDIKRLNAGEICEAFVLNTKGKILGFMHVAAGADELLLLGHGSQAPTLIQHLDMYLIREDVSLSDASDDYASFFVPGDAVVEKLGFDDSSALAENRFSRVRLGTVETMCMHLELAGFGYLFLCPFNDVAALKSTFVEKGLSECSAEALEILRVESKTPWFGIDLDDSNLPQEVQRDDQAISFNKGCYLGQETVARIDARGRVNQLLVGLQFAKEGSPGVGEDLTENDATIGRVTSVAHSFGQGCDVGMGYVRRKFKDAGTQLHAAVVLG